MHNEIIHDPHPHEQQNPHLYTKGVMQASAFWLCTIAVIIMMPNWIKQ